MFSIFKKLFGKDQSKEIKDAIENGAFLVDVRRPEEFNAGSIQGAINIPLDAISKQLKQFQDKKTIVVFCRSGMRSGRAKQILEKKGITSVYNGGGWQNLKRLLES